MSVPTRSLFDLQKFLEGSTAAVNRALDGLLPAASQKPATIHKAMRYSLFAGGKRMRPALCLAAAEACGGSWAAALPLACAVECIHTYSLIHDDLPAMDNDDFRRGRPTNHKVFGEAMAILAGDALLTEAFAVTSRCPAPPAVVVRVLGELASAVGAAGMVGGQVIDIEATGHKVDLALLRQLHNKKTGALLAVSVCAGARLGGGGEAAVASLRCYAEALGLAFQIIDDVLDVTADLQTLGKDPGSDREAGKTTYVDILGVDGARRHADEIMNEGIKALGPLGAAAEPLRALARYTIERNN